MTQSIIVIGEHEQGVIKGYTFELAAKAATLAQEKQGDVRVVFVGASVQGQAAQLGEVGVAHVTILDVPALEAQYNSDAYTNVITEYLQSQSATVVLASASGIGKDCLPRVATRLDTGLVADSVALHWNGDQLVARHPVYAGKALMDAVVESSPQMVAVRPNAFGAPQRTAGVAASVDVVAAQDGDVQQAITGRVEAESVEADLTEADIIVSGGRAVGSAENFAVIRGLAKALGGSVGASRAAVDAGYIGHDHQVGQTGKTVNPSLYVACGISGAIQHLAGMRTSRFIVAINKDADAPIFSKADFGIVGDLFEILPIVSEKIALLRQS